MESSFAELSLKLQKSLDSLIASSADIDKKLNATSQILKGLAGSNIAPSQDVLIELGYELWVQKTQQEAMDFYERQKRRLRHQYESIQSEIQKARKIAKASESLGALFETQEEEANNHSDGLPIVDIQENLDENGNVVEVKLNDKPFSVAAGLEKQLHPFRGASDDDGHLFSEQIKELLDDMELQDGVRSSDNQGDTLSVKEIEQTSVTAAENTATKLLSSEARAPIDTADLLELELIANDIDIDDESDPDEDHSFIENSSDSDEDFDERFSLFPVSSVHNDRLWQEVQNFRNKDKRETPNKGKKVRFKETLEINEVENVGEILRNVEHEKQSVSRFKETLILAGRSESKTSSDSFPDSDETQNHRFNSSRDEDVATDVIENILYEKSAIQHQNESKQDEDGIGKKPKTSRFKASRDLKTMEGKSEQLSTSFSSPILQENATTVKSGENKALPEDDDPSNHDEFEKLKQELIKDRSKKATSMFKRMISQNPNQTPRGKSSSSVSSIVSEMSTSAHKDQVTSLAKFNQNVDAHLEHSQSEARDLISAYNAGLFDDDVEVEGPVVNEIRDFERLNKIIESMPAATTGSDVTTVERDTSKYLDEMDNLSESVRSESDEEGVMSEIFEHEYEPSEYETENGNQVVEQEITQREVENNYYRLRQRIYAEFGDEIEAGDNNEVIL